MSYEDNAFEDILRHLDEIKKITPKAEKILNEFENYVGDRGQLASKNYRDRSETERSIAYQYMYGPRAEYLDIIEDELGRAISNSPEYASEPLLSDQLYVCFANPDVLRFEWDSSYNQIDVYLNPEKVAGTIEDFINGIKLARLGKRERSSKTHADTAEWSSRQWALIYAVAKEGYSLPPPKMKANYRKGYKKGGDFKQRKLDRNEQLTKLYYKIRTERFVAFKNKAPYWYILNYGISQSSTTREDGIGTAYPKQHPTHFVEESKRRIFNRINTQLADELNQMESEGSYDYGNADYEEGYKLREILGILESAVNNIDSLNTGQVLTKLEFADREINVLVIQSKYGSKKIGMRTVRRR